MDCVIKLPVLSPKPILGRFGTLCHYVTSCYLSSCYTMFDYVISCYLFCGFRCSEPLAEQLDSSTIQSRDQTLWLRVLGFGFRAWGLGLRVQGLGLGLGYRV